MEKILFYCYILSISCSLHAGIENLDAYKEFLIKGTYGEQDWTFLQGAPLPKSRYDTFKAAFKLFEDNQGKVIVELGTSRSFTHGGHIGCNSDDKSYWDIDHPENWDWGAGFFTRMSALCLAHLSPQIHTVDIAFSHIERCKWMTKDLKD